MLNFGISWNKNFWQVLIRLLTTFTMCAFSLVVFGHDHDRSMDNLFTSSVPTSDHFNLLFIIIVIIDTILITSSNVIATCISCTICYLILLIVLVFYYMIFSPTRVMEKPYIFMWPDRYPYRSGILNANL